MIILLILLIVTNSVFAEAQNECLPTSCHASGPIIRFPFRLRGRQPVHCGYPGFDLSCNSNNLTEFDFQFSIRASARNIILPITARAIVQEINYQTQVIRVSFLNGSCLPNRVPALNVTPSPFQMYNQYNVQNNGYTLFNCSGRPEHNYPQTPITCLDSGVFRVYAFLSLYSLGEFPTSNCAKMYNISDVSEVIFNGPSRYTVDDTRLYWPEPVCQVCETRGSFCSLRNNETVCVERPREPQQNNNNGGLSRNARTAIIIVSVLVAAIVVAAICRIFLTKKRKRNNEKRIQQFLEDYKALRPSRYTYAELKEITDGFKHKLGQGGFGAVYKGKLSDDIFVAVKVLTNTDGSGEDFINEVKTIGKIHHIHVVRLVGYCADGYKRALVYDFLENDSLEKYLSSGNQSTTLGWEKLHKIAIGISKGIDYLHQGCNQRILHFDIKPQNILLDGNFNPKVADFGLAKLCSKDKSVITMTAARGTVGYIAPEVFSRNFGKVSYKSDMYSFGMLLLDMVGGRKKNDSCPNEQNSSSEIYFPEWMYNQLEKGGDIAIDIEKEDESDIVKRLTIVGLWCIQWYPVDRPSAKVVIQMLEGENLPIMPPNPFAATSKSVATANK